MGGDEARNGLSLTNLAPRRSTERTDAVVWRRAVVVHREFAVRPWR
jgi:hypothetical protein